MKWMDMHCDTVSELFKKRREGTLWKNNLCVDIERLKKSDSVAQFFACYVNAVEYPGWEEAFDAAEKLIQSVHEEESKEFCVAGSAAELKAAQQVKKYAGILTVEEGGVLNGKAERVEQLYEQGMYPGMMIAVWDKSKHLFQLIDAVRCHDSRELVQIIRKPAKHA